ncbi:SDR family oxidoreductase [Escherichia albertii]|nr:SDR family oxidoreductase [Escherichia albertii]EJJ6392208.1 SDR family oxidoreductase [Escherichia albertii]EKB0157215.1 SDR family oxidoreductase [Escherichia albertii]MCZ9168934.1 SDR family oxidoreductase [Escherichia albertii]MCZ9244624.1 SDR family oxidoreductase [Escherichia albertii]
MRLLLLTGATGFLGGAVLANLLNSRNNINLLLLVRAPTLQKGLERVKENMRKFHICEDRLHSLTTDNILSGDLNNPESFLMDPRLNKVTHVINCAAVASFGNNPFIWNVNVTGTLAFAKRMAKVTGLKRFLHVGTAMSCTPDANSLVTEGTITSETGEHLVEYTHSKAIIEHLMRKQCPDLPLLIARPSIIVGHTRLGCLPSTSIFWVFRMGLMLQKFMCSLDDRIDVIPVDYCADALLMLLDSSLINGEIVHISAGKESSVTFSAIDKSIASALNRAPVGDKYTKVSYEMLAMGRREFKNIFGPCNERLMLKAIRLYGAFSMLNVCFSNEKLLGLGMPKPPKFTDYIKVCIETTKNLSIPQQMEVDFK